MIEYSEEPYKGRMSTFSSQPLKVRTQIYGKRKHLYWMQQNFIDGDVVIVQISHRIYGT